MSPDKNLQESEEDDLGRRLVPLAKKMLVGLTVFFFLASLGQLAYLHQQIANTPNLDLKEVVGKRIQNASANQSLLPLMELESRVSLEEYALKRRYHQANVLLMSRIWVSYLSFVTGMILSLVGASFILGRIREPVTKLDADSNFAKFSIASSSPGIILATLGTLLIITSIVTNHRIAVEDKPVYLHAYGYQPVAQRAMPGEHEEPVRPGDGALNALDSIFE